MIAHPLLSGDRRVIQRASIVSRPVTFGPFTCSTCPMQHLSYVERGKQRCDCNLSADHVTYHRLRPGDHGYHSPIAYAGCRDCIGSHRDDPHRALLPLLPFGLAILFRTV